jgi:CRP/FNR family transcriptional regulator
MMKLFNTILEQEMQAAGTKRKLPAETILLQKDKYVESIRVVLSGSMRVIRQDEEGKEILLYDIKPGESCIMTFLDLLL